MAAALKHIFSNKIYLLFFLLAFLFYGNSLKNKYALDDNFVTVTNHPVPGQPYTPDQALVSKGFKGIPKIWRTRYAHDGEGAFDYRPFVTTTFAIEYGLFGQNPFISHLVNILLYFISVCVAYKCILRIFSELQNRETIAFLCAFIFLVHPLHTEAIDNIKSRDEILSFLFSTLALLYSFRFYDERKKSDVLLVILCLVLGLASKRTTTTALAVIPMALAFFRPFKWKQVIALAVCMLLLAFCFYLFQRAMVKEANIRNYYHFESQLYFIHPSFIGRVFIALKCLGFYIGMLVFPYPMRFYYGESMFDLGMSVNVFLLISLAFLAASGWYFYKTRNKYFLFALFLFLGTIFPFLNFMTPMPGIVGDRLAFTASFGFCMMIAIVLAPYFKAMDFRNMTLSTFTSRPFSYLSVLALVCMVYVINRNASWHDKFTLFTHDIQYLGHSSKGNSLLANEYFEKMNLSRSAAEAQGHAEKALVHYKLAVKADSSMFSACNNAGVVLFTFYKNYEEAAVFFKLAIRAKHDYAQAYENLGNTYRMRKNYDTALMMYAKAIEFNKKQYATYDAIGQVYSDQQKYRQAEQAYDKALLEYPGEYYFSTQKANYAFMDGRQEEGLGLFEKAFALNPNEKLGLYIAEKFKALHNKQKEDYYRNYNYSR